MNKVTALGLVPGAPIGQFSQRAHEFADMDRGNRTRLRAKLLTRGFSAEEVASLLPNMTKKKDEIWLNLSQPILSHIADIFDMTELPTDAEWWTPDRAEVAATTLVDYYKTPAGANTNLAKFRNALRSIGIAPDALQATLRPDVYDATIKNDEARRKVRAEEGIDIPVVFRNIAKMNERVDKFIRDKEATPQTLADLIVLLSARPSEINTLEITDVGGTPMFTAGVLKKQGVQGLMYPIVSALDSDKVVAFLEAWRSLPTIVQRKVTSQLRPLVHSWGLQVRDLRAIGGTQAVNVRRLTGAIRNEATARDVLRAALRHDGAMDASARYQRVNV